MKKILCGLSLLNAFWGISQFNLVGINTVNPQAILHITDFNANENGVIENPRKETGVKIPTHDALPIIPLDTKAEKSLSKEKNGMLIHYYNSETSLQNFYYWDNNTYSWQGIMDSKNDNLNFSQTKSKTIIKGNKLTAEIIKSSTERVVFNHINSLNTPFYINENTNEIIVGESANYHLLITGAVEKSGMSGNVNFTLNTIRNDKNVITKSSYASSNTRRELRTANFYVSEILFLEKNDRIALTIKGGSSVETAYIKSPFTIMLIKLD